MKLITGFSLYTYMLALLIHNILDLIRSQTVDRLERQLGFYQRVDSEIYKMQPQIKQMPQDYLK